MRTKKITPWLFAGPALILLALFLVYPSVETIRVSFYNWNSKVFVGFQNYITAFAQPSMLTVFRNNAIWVFIFTLFTVSFGLMLAVLLDRVKYERILKSFIFVPVAISMVGASVIWKFVYAFRPAGAPQIGLLNAIVVAFGGQPIGWLIQSPWINNLCLIAVGVWMWTGFCMVFLSAAYKAIPKQLMEAARIDGANEWQVFRRVILPLLWSTIAVVMTTMVVFVLKIFDIVYVMTNGNYSTEVIANLMYKQQFTFQNYGQAGALAVVLLLLVVPMMIINIRRFKRQEAIR